MLFQSLIPSPALSIAQFSDIDAFRPVEFVADARSVPLNLANFHTARATVQLPCCQITALTSFARIVDVRYRVAHGVVILQLEDDYEVSANGMSVNGPAFIGMRGNVDCQFFEPRGSLHAIMSSGPACGTGNGSRRPISYARSPLTWARWRPSGRSLPAFCEPLRPNRI